MPAETPYDQDAPCPKCSGSCYWGHDGLLMCEDCGFVLDGWDEDQKEVLNDLSDAVEEDFKAYMEKIGATRTN